MLETIKYLNQEAKAKKNNCISNIEWNTNQGTSGISYIYATKNNVTCYMYKNKKGKLSNPTFSLINKKYPYGSDEVGYREAISLAKEK